MPKRGGARKDKVEFEEGDHVGARVKGHPIWPAIVEKVEPGPGGRKKYLVRFFHTNEVARNFQELKHYKSLSDKELGCTKKGFVDALKLCQQSYESSSKQSKQSEKQVKLLMSEEENVSQSSDRETIIAKIQGKVEAKLQEKEALKKRKKDQRLSEKVSRNFPIIEAKLSSLSKVFSTLRGYNPNQEISDWKQTVQIFHSFLPILEKFINTYFTTEHSRKYKERQKCYDLLSDIVDDLNTIKEEKILSAKYHQDVKNMVKKMTRHDAVRQFINQEKSKNAMTERNAVDLKTK